MVREKNELVMEEIVPPIFQASDNSIKLLIIGTKLLLCFIEFFAKECDGAAVLTKNAPNPESRGITLYLKSDLEIWQCQNRGLGNTPFKLFKRLGCRSVQLNVAFFKQSVIGATIELKLRINRR
jgi:hypothetical protein